jgi:flagellar hook-basal body complex protein FliE
MATPGIAANAYSQIARLSDAAGLGGGDLTGAKAAGGGSFTSMLKDALGAVSAAGQKSDAQTQAMVQGKANVIDVVTAVAETETAIGAVVAVRDKVIAAYEEIMRMQI